MDAIEPHRYPMYDELASWWPLLSSPVDYAEEAAFYAERLVAAADPPARTCLELGSGGGNNASHLKRRFEMTLVEPAAGMLDVSRRLNPECRHVQGDMRTVRLDATFDLVFVHDAVCYMTSQADLRAAIRTAALHCRPGGAALFAPDYLRETFVPDSDHGGHDDGGRGLRFVEWTRDDDPDDDRYEVDYGFLLRESDGSVRVVHERHVEGLFPRATWLRLMEEEGFVDVVATPLVHSEVGDGRHEVLVGRRGSGGHHAG
jgi:SAM-dependent methyltransferase